MVSSIVTSFRRTPFVGRERELADLAQLLTEAASGRGSLVLIGGDAGVGKSRLAEELARQTADQGFAALTGHSYEGEGTPPYIAFAEVLEAAARTLPEEALRALAAESGSGIARLVPALARLAAGKPPRGLPADDERHVLFNDVRVFLHELAALKPALLVLDDLHWADAPTVLLLRHVARSLDGTRLMIIGTYRDAEVDVLSTSAPSPISGLLEDLRRLPRASLLRLQPLPEDAVAAMLRSLTGKESPDSVTRAVYEQTEGNPFFVEEVVNHLLEEGRLLAPDGTWRDDAARPETDVPEGVRRVIGRRLQRVSGEARHVLTTAAVIGRTFDFDLLNAVAGQPAETLLDCLDEAERMRLVMSERETGQARLSFAHELIRQTLLTQISLPRRQGLHLAIVRAIEAAGEPADARISDLARHSLLAGPAADREKTIEYLEGAGQHANRTTAYEEAARLYGEALRLLPPGDDARRCELTIKLGESQKRVRDSDEARETFFTAAALARKLGDSQLLCRAALGVTRSWPTIGLVDEPAVAVLREALAQPDGVSIGLRANLTARLSLQLYYSPDPDEVKALAARAVELARQSGEPVTMARCLQTRHVALWEPQHTAVRLAIANEIIEVAERSGVRLLALWGRRPRIADLMEMGETDAALLEFEAYSRLANEIRQPIFMWQASVRRAMLSIYPGRLAEGERLAGDALALGQRAGGQNLVAAYGEQMLVTRWLQGRVSEMEPLARAMAANQPQLGLWRAILAFILAETGKETEARAELEALAADGFAALPADDTRPIAVTTGAVACAALGDVAKARVLYDELLPSEGHNLVFSEGVVCAGPASYYLGILAATFGGLPAAERHYRDAIAFGERSGGRPWFGLANAAYAEMLFARRGPGDRKQALELVAEALTAARELGMAGLQAKAERLLGSHKGTAKAFPDGLTRREVEVLRLLAAGKSNKEISETLVLSLRTTARHITNIYGKINARNRSEATAYTIRHELFGG